MSRPPKSLKHCEFRFYEELNDFLPPARRKVSFRHAFSGSPTVKDRIQALGVPHTEVDLILVDGVSVDFQHHLHGGERVAVYPTFERFDLAELNRLRPAPLRHPCFVLDVHLGRLARYLRLLGLDTLYRNDWPDEELAQVALAEHRILLTRDVGLLKRNAVTHGAFLRAIMPREQLLEVLERFDLWRQLRLFSRCARCNGAIEAVTRASVAAETPPRVYAYQRHFYRCQSCRKLYWEGKHCDRLRHWLEPLLREHGLSWPESEQAPRD